MYPHKKEVEKILAKPVTAWLHKPDELGEVYMKVFGKHVECTFCSVRPMYNSLAAYRKNQKHITPSPIMALTHQIKPEHQGHVLTLRHGQEMRLDELTEQKIQILKAHKLDHVYLHPVANAETKK